MVEENFEFHCSEMLQNEGFLNDFYDFYENDKKFMRGMNIKDPSTLSSTSPKKQAFISTFGSTFLIPVQISTISTSVQEWPP